TKLTEEVLNTQLLNEKNEQTTLQGEIEKHKELNGVVIFVYPKADTPGCTEQAKLFKEKFEEFKSNNYAVYGLSADSADAQLKWKEKLELPFELLCDVEKKVLKEMGCLKEDDRIARSHAVIKNDSVVSYFKKGVKPGMSAENVLKFIIKGEKDEDDAETDAKAEDDEMEGADDDDDDAGQKDAEGADINGDIKGEGKGEAEEGDTKVEGTEGSGGGDGGENNSPEDEGKNDENGKEKKVAPSAGSKKSKNGTSAGGGNAVKSKKKASKKNNNGGNKNSKAAKKGISVKKEIKKK
ncbi:merozoite capping protein 1, partial [Plasmodium cynomolgi strain B]